MQTFLIEIVPRKLDVDIEASLQFVEDGEGVMSVLLVVQLAASVLALKIPCRHMQRGCNRHNGQEIIDARIALSRYNRKLKRSGKCVCK